MDEALWKDEPAREWARSEARERLWRECIKASGRDLPKGQFDALPVWIENPDWYVIECVGGPGSGTLVTMPGTYEPGEVHVPDGDGRAVYGPLTDEHGFGSRSDDGAWRYGPKT